MSEKSVLLSSGHQMPLLGLGCWLAQPNEVSKAVEVALEAGYRHIDTATVYFNETEVGTGLKNWLAKSGKTREDVFVVTKLPGTGMFPNKVENYLRRSLKQLALSYVDLYLIHTPVGMKGKDDNDLIPMDENKKIIMDFSTDLIAIWKEMERMVELGLTKSIGVSNFNIKQLKKICAVAKIPPVVNQIEVHLYFQQREMQEFCKEHNIYITAYGPLGSPGKAKFFGKDDSNAMQLLTDPAVGLVAERHNVTPAQVLIRFLIQNNFITIPKSVSPDRIKTNFDVWGFKLSDLEMAVLRNCDKGKNGRLFNSFIEMGMTDHPECPF